MVHFTGKNSHGDSLVSVATSLPWSTHYVGTLLGLPAWDVNRPDASQVGEFCVCILANLAGVYCIYIYIYILHVNGWFCFETSQTFQQCKNPKRTKIMKLWKA